MSDREWATSLARFIEASLECGEADVALGLPDDPELSRLGAAVVALRDRWRRLNEETEKLAALNDRVNAGTSLSEVMGRVFADYQGILPYQRIGLALITERERRAKAVWAESDTGRFSLAVGFEADLDGSSLQALLKTGRPRILNDLVGYLEKHPNSRSTALIVKEGFLSSLTCPLVAAGKPIGFVFFSSRARNAYTAEHQERFSKLAAHLSLVVHKARLIEELTESNRRLEFANTELSRLATEDALTGLSNRRYFDARITAEWRRTMRDDAPLSLLYADIDFFKQYNDVYGHVAGDACLRSVALAIRGAAQRGGDLVCRLGGEEFAVLLAGVDQEGAKVVGEKMRQSIEALSEEHRRSELGRVTISVGVASIVRPSIESVEQLKERADFALYEAKRQGRNRVCVAPPLESPPVARRA